MAALSVHSAGGGEPETDPCAERKGSRTDWRRRRRRQASFLPGISSSAMTSVGASIGHRFSNSRPERGGDILCSPLRQCVGTGLQDRLSH